MTILSRSRRRGPALLVAAAMVGSAFVLTAAAKPSDAVAGRQIGRHHVVPAPAQRRVDLGHAAVVAVAQHADQRHHVQAELVLRQSYRAFRLRPVGTVMARAIVPLAAPDLQPQPHRTRKRHQGAGVVVAQAHRVAASRAGLLHRPQHLFPIRPLAG